VYICVDRIDVIRWSRWYSSVKLLANRSDLQWPLTLLWPWMTAAILVWHLWPLTLLSLTFVDCRDLCVQFDRWTHLDNCSDLVLTIIDLWPSSDLEWSLISVSLTLFDLVSLVWASMTFDFNQFDLCWLHRLLLSVDFELAEFLLTTVTFVWPSVTFELTQFGL